MSKLPNAACEQRKRLLERLRHGTVSTLEARRELDIMHPAARVMELRNAGYQIDRLTVDEPSDCGRLHKVARYLLVPTGDSVTAPLPFPTQHHQTRRPQ
jgi:hypothetical protein